MKTAGKRWRPSTPLEIYRQTQAEEAREARHLRLCGWPVITGTPEEQSERHARALAIALRDEGKISR